MVNDTKTLVAVGVAVETVALLSLVLLLILILLLIFSHARSPRLQRDSLENAEDAEKFKKKNEFHQ